LVLGTNVQHKVRCTKNNTIEFNNIQRALSVTRMSVTLKTVKINNINTLAFKLLKLV
jgi:hypothetical protein